MENSKKTIKHKGWIILSCIILVIVLLFGILFGIVYNNPQIIVGALQSALYGENPINSFESFGEPIEHVKKNGFLYKTEIQYGTEYPNSYLDISYTTEDTTVDRPTVIYFHGGGYFGGDKSLGDPLAVNDNANALFDKIVLEGYNFVNVNYALVPDYHYPVPLIQMNQAIDFLKTNSEEYNLNMDNIILFGQSAGAIMVAQYGAMMSNPEYAEHFGITPALPLDSVSALIIDDAPLIFDKFSISTKLLVGNYLDTMSNKKAEEMKYNPIPYINENYPATFLIGSNESGGYEYDMSVMDKKLSEVGVTYEHFYRDQSYDTTMHGFLNNILTDLNAQACYDEMIAFINNKSKIEK